MTAEATPTPTTEDAVTTQPITVEVPHSLWAVTTLAHEGLRDWNADCEACLALVPGAIITAQVTGSVGATEQRTSAATNETHSATVARAIRTYRTSSDPAAVELARRAL